MRAGRGEEVGQGEQAREIVAIDAEEDRARRERQRREQPGDLLPGGRDGERPLAEEDHRPLDGERRGRADRRAERARVRMLDHEHLPLAEAAAELERGRVLRGRLTRLVAQQAHRRDEPALEPLTGDPTRLLDGLVDLAARVRDRLLPLHLQALARALRAGRLVDDAGPAGARAIQPAAGPRVGLPAGLHQHARRHAPRARPALHLGAGEGVGEGRGALGLGELLPPALEQGAALGRRGEAQGLHRLLEPGAIALVQHGVDAGHPLGVEGHLHDDQAPHRVPQLAEQPRVGHDPRRALARLDEVLELIEDEDDRGAEGGGDAQRP